MWRIRNQIFLIVAVLFGAEGVSAMDQLQREKAGIARQLASALDRIGELEKQLAASAGAVTARDAALRDVATHKAAAAAAAAEASTHKETATRVARERDAATRELAELRLRLGALEKELTGARGAESAAGVRAAVAESARETHAREVGQQLQALQAQLGALTQQIAHITKERDDARAGAAAQAHRDELQRLGADHAAALDALRGEKDDAARAHRDELAARDAALREEKEAHERTRDAAAAAARDHDAALRQKDAAHAGELTARDDAHRKALDERGTAHAAELDALRAQHARELAARNAALKEEKEAHERTRGAAVAAAEVHQRALDALRGEKDDAVRAHNAALRQKDAAHAVEVERLRADHAAALDALRARHATALGDLRDQHAAALAARDAAHATALKAEQDEHERTRGVLDERNAALAQLKGDHEALRAQHEALIDAREKANEELQGLRREVDRLGGDLAAAGADNERAEALRKARENLERVLQDFGNISSTNVKGIAQNLLDIRDNAEREQSQSGDQLVRAQYQRVIDICNPIAAVLDLYMRTVHKNLVVQVNGTSQESHDSLVGIMRRLAKRTSPAAAAATAARPSGAAAATPRHRPVASSSAGPADYNAGATAPGSETERREAARGARIAELVAAAKDYKGSAEQQRLAAEREAQDGDLGDDATAAAASASSERGRLAPKLPAALAAAAAQQRGVRGSPSNGQARIAGLPPQSPRRHHGAAAAAADAPSPRVRPRPTVAQQQAAAAVTDTAAQRAKQAGVPRLDLDAAHRASKGDGRPSS